MLTARFDEAFRYAHDVHRAQRRKGSGIVYMAHLIDVAAIVLVYGGGEDEAIAALLHDAPEDHGGRPRLEDIRHRFGDIVAEIVEGCTDTFDTPKPAWLPRKRAYIAHVENRRTPGHVLLVSRPISCRMRARFSPIGARMATVRSTASPGGSTAPSGTIAHW
jgi:hypothetical protein